MNNPTVSVIEIRKWFGSLTNKWAKKNDTPVYARDIDQNVLYTIVGIEEGADHPVLQLKKYE